MKTISFIAVLARLEFKFNKLEAEERGGLLIEEQMEDEDKENTLQYLVKSSHLSYDEDHNQIVANVFLTQIIRLRRMGLLKKEDILNLFRKDYSSGRRRIQFSVELDAALLLQTDEDGWLPFYWAVLSSVQLLQVIFEYCIIYYPNKKGFNLMITTDEESDIGTMPFKWACAKHGSDEVRRKSS